ncbi:helix-turn-helix domain-containing protein [Marixanthomonas spongiae]|uniref:DNA-binding protein n=1 Tax=Marixanthomonas spongiae TaxID=2174845 RepID=A0A2U0I2K0_9FLAO|nr:helix-turn-helix domain-containing protein [Marixanthomonas spongiae]PVW15329.1 DNA-binding protein [Marixanthomonas spongiae]
MKQPELGQKIVTLRKQKGFTQEELVEKCNINVRTIQRIEAGEVTPRSYTIKSILDALDFDLEAFEKETETDVTFNETMLSNSKSFLTLAVIGAIIYFIIGFPEFALDWARFFENEMILGNVAYISVKCIALVSYLYFSIGFIRVGKIFENSLLTISTYVLIAMTLLFYVYDISSLYFDGFAIEYVVVIESIFYGLGGFLFGYSLLKLSKPLGIVATVAGGFKMASSVFLLSVFLGWLGALFLIPAVLLEIVLLYKVKTLSNAKNVSVAI